MAKPHINDHKSTNTISCHQRRVKSIPSRIKLSLENKEYLRSLGLYNTIRIEMEDILNIKKLISFDNRISKIEYHSYNLFLASYDNSDEIRIAIQNQDLYLLPSESFLYVEGSIAKEKGAAVEATTSYLNNNAIAFLFRPVTFLLRVCP